MKIENLKVYDLEESLVASGYAMKTDTSNLSLTDNDTKRALKLVSASVKDRGNNAHIQFLSGVRVSFDLTCSNKMWVELERYKFIDFVTSQSTMHRISKFDIKEHCNEYVTESTINEINRLKSEYDKNDTKDNYLRLLYNIPSGFELTARLSTNYRCLLNVYNQRRNHRLPEWRQFCVDMYSNLPFFSDIVDEFYKN